MIDKLPPRVGNAAKREERREEQDIHVLVRLLNAEAMLRGSLAYRIPR